MDNSPLIEVVALGSVLPALSMITTLSRIVIHNKFLRRLRLDDITIYLAMVNLLSDIIYHSLTLH